MIDANIRDEAALWMARARDPKFSDWDGLTEWLEASPAHNLAYEEAYHGHDLAGVLGGQWPSVAPAHYVDPPRRHWRAIGGGLIGTAAAAAAIIALFAPFAAQDAGIPVQTRSGEHRIVRLRDGTEIALNGDSRLVLDRGNDRTVRIERGEAMFNVVHNDARPFTVDAGDTRMIDLGTRFNVVRSSHGSEVAVAEGSVLFDPEGAAVRLGAGHMLRKREGSPIVEVSQADTQAVGGWRSGHLVYRDAPLWRVAEDLARATGVAIDLDPALIDRPFTGAFAVREMSRESLRARLAAILDVMVAQKAEGLYLRPRAGG